MSNQLRVQQPVSFEANPEFNKQPVSFVGQFGEGDATPSVLDLSVFKCGSLVVTITQFREGQSGQTIRILGNANTTIANNANIKTNTGADKVLSADKVYTFTYINNVWYESE